MPDLARSTDDPRILVDDYGWLVASRSHPGAWHRVDHDGACDCPGFEHRGRCRHVDLLGANGHAVPLAQPAPAPDPADQPFDQPEVDWPAAGDTRWLWTSRYQNRRIAESGLVPVRTSLGAPRFRVSYPLAEACPLLMPVDLALADTDPDAFVAAYLAKLDAAGPGAILDELRAIVRRHAGRGLVLLCFEDVLTGVGRKGFCHRRLLADFLRERTGIVVPELADARVTATERPRAAL